MSIKMALSEPFCMPSRQIPSAFSNNPRRLYNPLNGSDNCLPAASKGDPAVYSMRMSTHDAGPIAGHPLLGQCDPQNCLSCGVANCLNCGAASTRRSSGTYCC